MTAQAVWGAEKFPESQPSSWVHTGVLTRAQGRLLRLCKKAVGLWAAWSDVLRAILRLQLPWGSECLGMSGI